ncbi:MAG: hypothetical protein H7A16_09710 [Sinobacteraceae bacterium]|nr:hypothetical protein [Nevskiaceae bacterium]MCP5340433.1 hypothetical protein [Nevskiaceae bacterium]
MGDLAVGLDPGVPDPIRMFVAERVAPVFADLGRLLAAPRDAEGRGFEAVILPSLFALLNALSRVFFHSATGERQSFMAIAERYPADDEPAHAIKDPRLFAEALHAHYGASLLHGLGLHMKRDGRYEPWRIAPVRVQGRELRLSVERLRALSSGGEALLAGLDAESGWPTGVGPTLTLTTDSLRLELDAFYCGLRRLVRRLAEDKDLWPGALAVLAPWYAATLQSQDERAEAILGGDAAAGGSTSRPMAGGSASRDGSEHEVLRFAKGGGLTTR